MAVKIQIPVRPLVKEYLEKKFGSPVSFSRKDHIGKLFYSLLEKPSTKKDAEYTGYSETLTINITEDLCFRYGHIMTPTNVIAFNNFVNDLIYDAMVSAIDNSKSEKNYRGAMLKAYERFIKNNGISELSLNYASARKVYYRAKK